uniref:Anoctamin n=1 Tax=Dracunculus medinensis TaxID=318479 RepID=A0A0N4U193_DRAME
LNLNEYRGHVYYVFGLVCLVSWFIFNLWILRDYFFPWIFPPIYTQTGLKMKKLEATKMQLIRKDRLNNAFTIPAAIILPYLSPTCRGNKQMI